MRPCVITPLLCVTVALVTGVFCAADNHSHDDEELNPYHLTLAQHKGALPLADLREMVEVTQKRTGCAKAKSCECLTMSALATYLSASPAATNTSELQFQQTMLLTLYLAANTSAACSNGLAGKSPADLVTWFTGYEAEELGRNFTVQLKHFISDVTKTYTTGHMEHDDHRRRRRAAEKAECYHPPEHADRLPCFNYVLAMGEHAGEAKLDQAEALEVAGRLGYSLYRGKPVRADCDPIPEPEHFLDEIFEVVEADNKKPMSEEKFELLMKKMGLGSTASGGQEAHVVQDDGHNHRRRRREVAGLLMKKLRHRQRRAADEHEHENKCYSPEDILQTYAVDGEKGVSKPQLTAMCPALLQQQVFAACKQKHPPRAAAQKLNQLQRYGAGFISVLIISLCAVVGVVLIPAISAHARRLVLSVFVGLAVGALCGDAVLHLIPEAFGLHDHAHASDALYVIEPYTFKALGLLAAIYVFFLVETLMARLKKSPKEEEAEDTQELGTKPVPLAEVHTVAWMVIIGDSVHNLADGLAIGAAFSVSLSGGISTSLAVLCHELPHELGDMAVLLNAGMRPCLAVLFNFLSACSAFVGVFIALGVAHSAAAQGWILTVAAGMFLYVSLCDMVPELLAMQRHRWFLMVLFQSIGICCGVGLMIVLSLFEHRIRV